MKLKDGDNKLTITKEIEYKDRFLTVEIKIWKRFGAIDIDVMDNATGDTIDLNINLNTSPIEFLCELTSNDTMFASLTPETILINRGEGNG